MTGSGAVRPQLSVAARITALVVLILILMAVIAVAVARLGFGPGLSLLLVLLAGIPLGAWLVSLILRPLDRLLRALGDGISSFSDRDYSVRLADAYPAELGELARLYNRVADILQEERHELRQRELLLATALDSSPVAVILVGPTGRVVYANAEARTLLVGGARLEGWSFAEIVDGCPQRMREILAAEADGVFSVLAEERSETYSVSRRLFTINRRRHTLVLVHRITAELERREAEVWKKVIRVISHELNNSLAPVSSLVHSARTATRSPQHAGRAEEIFATIQERIGHLKRFIDGYARFARLPPPHQEEVDWEELVAALGEYPDLKLVAPLPPRPGYFDRAQVQQLLVNLLKNAVEASDGEPDLSLRVGDSGEGGCFLQVLDRGRGMDGDTMQRALLPFYSTKQSGSGLGLPLCREIVDAHGGRLSLQARPGGGTIVTCWFPPRR